MDLCSQPPKGISGWVEPIITYDKTVTSSIAKLKIDITNKNPFTLDVTAFEVVLSNVSEPGTDWTRGRGVGGLSTDTTTISSRRPFGRVTLTAGKEGLKYDPEDAELHHIKPESTGYFSVAVCRDHSLSSMFTLSGAPDETDMELIDSNPASGKPAAKISITFKNPDTGRNYTHNQNLVFSNIGAVPQCLQDLNDQQCSERECFDENGRAVM